MTTGGTERPERRFTAIDAMRGIAALSVLVYHLFRNSPMHRELDAAVPDAVAYPLDLTRNGVAVFFVISGFVIAYTTRHLGATPGGAVRFAVRRQLRLDPPYFVVIALVALGTWLERQVPGLDYQQISPHEVLASMFYAQGFAGTQPVLAVAWTLCLEVQFYIVVILVIKASGIAPPALRGPIARAVFFTLGAISLLASFAHVDFGPWFLGLWWMFFLGMVTCWALIGVVRRGVLVWVGAALVAVLIARDVQGTNDPWHGDWVALATYAVIAMLFHVDRLSARPPGWLLYAGAISYSLYLVHLPVIDTVVALGYKVLPSSTASAFALYVVGAAASIVGASVLHRFVERPAMRFAARFRDAPEPAPSLTEPLVTKGAQRHTT